MNKRKGFTLVEVMLATAIMVTALAAFVYGLTQSANLTETVRNQDIAINAAQEKLEEIANSNLSQIMNYNKLPLNSFSVSGLTPTPAGNKVTVKQVGTTNLYDVTVTVTWQQRGGRQISRTISTTLVQK